MSEVKYKAVQEYSLCDGCINKGTLDYENGACKAFIKRMILHDLPDCNDGYIYQLDTESDTSKVTLEQAREKFEESFTSEDFQEYDGYIQALKDHDILEEGE